MNEKFDLNWFEVFDCLLRLGFKFMYLMPNAVGNWNYAKLFEEIMLIGFLFYKGSIGCKE
jgi:hypothetical protein